MDRPEVDKKITKFAEEHALTKCWDMITTPDADEAGKARYGVMDHHLLVHSCKFIDIEKKEEVVYKVTHRYTKAM